MKHVTELNMAEVTAAAADTVGIDPAAVISVKPIRKRGAGFVGLMVEWEENESEKK